MVDVAWDEAWTNQLLPCADTASLSIQEDDSLMFVSDLKCGGGTFRWVDNKGILTQEGDLDARPVLHRVCRTSRLTPSRSILRY